ncbi:MAG TPA: AAA family ATPase [Ornithinimicrobium sp.]|nr:AAA family ATPase [Ornithinimicrobium sp.]
MRLHRITLRDVKGVGDRTVELPAHGVVVLEGPNEVGKTTLLEAFDRLLDLRCTSTSARVRALQPVGRDVGPYVAAEFTVAGQRVRLAKRWLRSPLTELDVLGSAPEHLTGSAAQARLDQLLDGALDRTLWQALRLTQSSDGTVAPMVGSGALREALDAAAEAHAHDGDGERVLNEVEAEYQRYFTARAGRPTGDYRAAIEAYHRAQQEVGEAHRLLEEASRLLERQEEAREEVRRCRKRLEEARAEATATARQAAEVEGVVESHRRAAEVHRLAQDRARSAGRELATRRRLVSDLAELSAQVGQDEGHLGRLQARAEQLAPALAQAEERRRAAEEDARAAEERLEAARADLDHCRDRVRLHERQALADRLTRLVVELEHARAAVPANPLSTEELREVERQEQHLAVLTARHEQASASVVVESLGADVDVALVDRSGGGQDDEHRVEPATTATFRVTRDLEVTVPGAVRVRVGTGPDAQQRRAEIHAARTALEGSLARARCVDVGSARDLAVRTRESNETVRRLGREAETLLAAHGLLGPGSLDRVLGGELPVALESELTTLTTRFEEEVAPGGRETPPRTVPQDEDAARAAERSAVEALRSCRQRLRGAVTAVDECGRQAQDVVAAVDRLSFRLQADRDRLTQLGTLVEAAREETQDEVLLAEAQRCAEEESAAEAELGRAWAAVSAADVEGVTRRAGEAEQRSTRIASDLDRAQQVLHGLSGQVELAASEGRQELYDLAEAALDEAERRLAGLDRRARAVRHLRTTLHAHRDAAHRAYVRPFTEALEGLGRRVYGPTFAVTVDEELSLRARSLGGSTIPFEDLSGGAKEQLGILARLAVARLVDPSQGVPVVIDDALGYSDPDRLHRMGEVLGAMAGDEDEVQVILLTCTPGRYASVPGARTVRLEPEDARDGRGARGAADRDRPDVDLSA